MRIAVYGMDLMFSVWHSERLNSKRSIQQLITKYCLPDQLLDVKIYTHNDIHLPNHFRRVQKLYVFGGPILLVICFTHKIHYLFLKCIVLDSNFDWPSLQNLTQLYLSEVIHTNQCKEFH